MTERKWTEEENLEESNHYPISASALKSYWKCPEQYRYRYKTNLSGTKKSKGFLELGSAVHTAIEETLLQDPPLYEDRLSRDFRKEYRKCNNDVPDDMVGDGSDYLEVAARYLESADPDIQGVEQEFSFGLSSLDRRFRGIIDVVTSDGIIDWKTGRVDSERTPDEEKLQGGVYMMSHYRSTGEIPNSIDFLYLKEEKKRSLNPSDEIWNEVKDVAKNLIQSEESGSYEADPDDSKCFFCGFEQFCSYSSVGVGDIEYTNF